MFAVIQPRSLTLRGGQHNPPLIEPDPSSRFSTDVTFVLGAAATHISAQRPVQPIPGSDLPSSAAAVLESVLQPGIRFGPFRLISRLGAGPREMSGRRGDTSRTSTSLLSRFYARPWQDSLTAWPSFVARPNAVPGWSVPPCSRSSSSARSTGSPT